MNAGLAVAQELIDPNALDLIRSLQPEAGDELLAQLIGIYLEDAPKHIVAMRAATQHSDVDALRVAAHTLKSSSAQLGALRLSESCRTLEQRARSKQVDDAALLVSDVEREFAQVRAAFEQLRAA